MKAPLSPNGDTIAVEIHATTHGAVATGLATGVFQVSLKLWFT
jgi:hypothetical protein